LRKLTVIQAGALD